jgi:hypothetical protein
LQVVGVGAAQGDVGADHRVALPTQASSALVL